MNRREFLRTAGGAAGGTAVLASAGTATAAEESTEGGGGGGKTVPVWPDAMSDANGFDEASVADKRGSDTATVKVGSGSGTAFSPPTLWVSPGTTVKFEWTGQGGAHNVKQGEGPASLDSGSAVDASGVQYEYTFEETGINTYHCTPHESLGMIGGIAVGDDIETTTVETGGGGGGEADPEHMGVPFQAHFVGIATVVMMLVSLIFTFYLLKYGESAHTKGGN